jgi:hypothetical protein
MNEAGRFVSSVSIETIKSLKILSARERNYLLGNSTQSRWSVGYRITIVTAVIKVGPQYFNTTNT